MLDKQKFLKLISGLADLYSADLSDFVIELYYEALSEYDYEAVFSACKILIKTYKYNALPKPAHIIDQISEQRPPSIGRQDWPEPIIPEGMSLTKAFEEEMQRRQKRAEELVSSVSNKLEVNYV